MYLAPALASVLSRISDVLEVKFARDCIPSQCGVSRAGIGLVYLCLTEIWDKYQGLDQTRDLIQGVKIWSEV